MSTQKKNEHGCTEEEWKNSPLTSFYGTKWIDAEAKAEADRKLFAEIDAEEKARAEKVESTKKGTGRREGRPKSPNTPTTKPKQIKRPQIGTRVSQADWLTLKNLGTVHPRVMTKNITEFYSEFVLRFLIEKPWINSKFDYDSRESSFFIKAPSPTVLTPSELAERKKLEAEGKFSERATGVGSRRAKDAPMDIILRTLDMQDVISPFTGKAIPKENLLVIFRNAVLVLIAEKSNIVVDGEPQPKYWAAQYKKDIVTGEDKMTPAGLSDATVAYSMIQWIRNEIYGDDVPPSRYIQAKMYTGTKLPGSDSEIFGLDAIKVDARGGAFDLYTYVPPETKEEKEKREAEEKAAKAVQESKE
ncbi:hypothetical protein AAKU67_004315 [Oxalobacteraceae bacterium GrIS 2.11]